MRRGTFGNRKIGGGLNEKEIQDKVFVKSETQITKPVTKFGGQPVWIEKPEWAVSLSTGNPMRFICQIALDQELFENSESKMAYIFMTDEEEYVDGTWEPDGGENAVIIQPSGNNPNSVYLEAGPSLYEMREVENEEFLQPFDCEFSIESVLSEDEEEFEEGEFENKMGGYPYFLQGEEYPSEVKEEWNLLLQLDSASVPFEINFGDSGVGYAFISKNGKTGKFLWQCC